jgi:hypothetical protein
MYDWFMLYVCVGLALLLVALTFGSEYAVEWERNARKSGLGFMSIWAIVIVGTLIWCLTWPFWIARYAR